MPKLQEHVRVRRSRSTPVGHRCAKQADRQQSHTYPIKGDADHCSTTELPVERLIEDDSPHHHSTPLCHFDHTFPPPRPPRGGACVAATHPPQASLPPRATQSSQLPYSPLVAATPALPSSPRILIICNHPTAHHGRRRCRRYPFATGVAATPGDAGVAATLNDLGCVTIVQARWGQRRRCRYRDSVLFAPCPSAHWGQRGRCRYWP